MAETKKPNGRLRGWVTISMPVAVLATAIGLCVSQFAGRPAADEARIETQLSDHEARLRLAEQHLTEIRTDVRWIRQQLESKPR